jgi:hypothetical protein
LKRKSFPDKSTREKLLSQTVLPKQNNVAKFAVFTYKLYFSVTSFCFGECLMILECRSVGRVIAFQITEHLSAVMITENQMLHQWETAISGCRRHSRHGSKELTRQKPFPVSVGTRSDSEDPRLHPGVESKSATQNPALSFSPHSRTPRIPGFRADAEGSYDRPSPSV